MKVSRIALGLTLASAIAQHVHGQVAFNCASFNSGTGTCGANTGSTGPFKIIGNHGSITGSGQLQLAPANTSHTALAANYTTPVNVQAFSTTYTFIPSGNVLAFVLQNTNNQPGYQGIFFVAGAGCEGGFFQASNVGVGGQSPNNVFAVTMDGFNYLTPGASSFAYSGTAMYQATQDPCKPNDGDPVYNPVNNISTSPVPLNNPVNTPNTTTGHTYSVTITYDGSNLIENLFDVTAGGSCPGASCFTHTWTGVNIPAIVGGSNTALAGITASTISAGNAGAVLINSWYYSNTPPSIVSISANQSKYGWQVLPGDVRRIYATITNGTTNKVNWSVASTTGGASATLSATSNTFPWVDVTLGSGAGSCSISPAAGSGNVTYTATSTAIVTIRAQSVDDTSKTVDFPFDVCAPSTQVFVTPFYNVLYSGQKADVQTWVLGNNNQNVTWAITSQPGGGDGTLADTTNRDTVFSATVTGRYTLTATSAADGSKTNTATFYVTTHALPYSVTPLKTMPVDCTADPSSSGVVYEVGPTQATYHTITSVPWTTLTAGSTVRIHNEDLTGTSPTTYHEYFPFSGTGTRTQPIRVCGVPDSLGNLPVIDGQNATPAVSTALQYTNEQYAAVTVGGNYATNWWGSWSPTWTGPQYLILEGLAIKNASSSVSHTAPDGTVGNWALATSGLRVWPSMDVVIRGNDVSSSDFGFFSDFNQNNGWALVAATDYEGNHSHNNGVVGQQGIHQFYLQGWLQLVQFNVVDKMVLGSGGINIKDRGIATVARYNYLADGLGATPDSPARVYDAVDNQDQSGYMGMDNLITTNWQYGPTMSADVMTAWYDQFHIYHMYGNVMQNSSALYGVHFMGDHGIYGAQRPGNLYFYNNTLNFSGSNATGIMDTDDNGGGAPFEYPQVLMQNNIAWQTPGTSACWTRTDTSVLNFVTNVISNGTLNNISTPIPQTACNVNTGWMGTGTSVAAYTSATPINNHMTGLSAPNFLATGTQPFTSGTYVPVSPQSGTVLSGSPAKMPVRFQFQPNLGYAIARAVPVTSTVGGTVGARDSSAPPSGLWNSLAGWATCILPGCDPGGTGIPVSTNQTILNPSPSLSGSSMLMSMVANQPDTNALWYWFAADCDLCTNFASDFEVYPVSSSNLGALELDTSFLFSQGLNREYMWGFQYCLNGAGCPGGHNSWDVWDQTAIDWIDSGVTQAPNFGAWNHITTTNHRSGTTQVYDTFTLNGTLHNLNIATRSGVLPMGWDSGTGFQFQLDANTPSGSQTYSMYLDQATFTDSTLPTAATPTFSPVAGTYTGTQSVTISTTSGSVICYNTTGAPVTNGTTGCITGTKYTGAVSVPSSETLYAIAGGTGFTDSAVGSAAYTITAPPTLSSIAVTPANILLNVGLNAQYTAICTWSDATTTNCTGTVTWASSAPSKATISATGLAAGVATGSTTISATQTAIVGSTGLTVTAPTVTSIAVSPVNSSVAINGTRQYSATCTWSNSTVTNCTSTVTWASSAITKATISVGGLATGIATGSTTISATSGVSGSTSLIVTSTKGTKVHGGGGRGRI